MEADLSFTTSKPEGFRLIASAEKIGHLHLHWFGCE